MKRKQLIVSSAPRLVDGKGNAQAQGVGTSRSAPFVRFVAAVATLYLLFLLYKLNSPDGRAWSWSASLELIMHPFSEFWREGQALRHILRSSLEHGTPPPSSQHASHTAPLWSTCSVTP